MDDIDAVRDDLQSTKQMLALELRNKEALERDNKRLQVGYNYSNYNNFKNINYTAYARKKTFSICRKKFFLRVLNRFCQNSDNSQYEFS